MWGWRKEGRAKMEDVESSPTDHKGRNFSSFECILSPRRAWWVCTEHPLFPCTGYQSNLGYFLSPFNEMLSFGGILSRFVIWYDISLSPGHNLKKSWILLRCGWRKILNDWTSAGSNITFMLCGWSKLTLFSKNKERAIWQLLRAKRTFRLY